MGKSAAVEASALAVTAHALLYRSRRSSKDATTGRRGLSCVIQRESPKVAILTAMSQIKGGFEVVRA